MFSATRRWFNRNRTPLAIGAGLVGAGYLATQYVLNKLSDARERMSSDRIAKENLRRRFEQNQEDCTFTVLALLPTATAGILEALDTERITYEIQTMKGQKAGGAPGGALVGSTAPSIADTTLTEEDGRSLAASSVQSESGVHASQITVPPQQSGDGTQDGGAAPLQSPTQQQQQQQKSRKTKRQLWDDLTISSVTRSFTLIYTLALLTMLTRIQLNLLGRRSYLSSVISLAAGGSAPTSGPISLENNDDDSPDHAYGNDFETNRKYLAFSWWLLNRGWRDLSARVEDAVRQVFGALSPRDLLSFQRFAELTLEVRKIVEGGSPKERRENKAWLGYLLPDRANEDEVIRESGILEEGSTVDLGAGTGADLPVSLRRLLDETSDLIESPAFRHVLTLLLDTGFSELVDRQVATSAFELPPQGDLANPASGPDDFLVGGAPLGTTLGAEAEEERAALRRTKVVQLPRILSVLTRQAHLIGNGMPNEYLREIERVRDLEAFAAVVYSSNWESDVMRDEGLLGSAAGGLAPQPEKSQAETQTGTQPSGGDESLVVVDSSQGFEGAWGRATLGKQA
ncbi:Peroxin-3 family protein [Plectosphaerella plurivora]|uniref:Peroxin-3 family protein n=1 Tax=Plectosphaerella plurivora TaxID=936078 RepID=A0A9P9A6T9_9PEZI|nr:Peroxin-3 family protein [Plectosphaerella plurivora]